MSGQINGRLDELGKQSYMLLDKVKNGVAKEFADESLSGLCIFSCGSLARMEAVSGSDLDVFFIAPESHDLHREDAKRRFLERFASINNKLGFEKRSADYLHYRIMKREEFLDIGHPEEDSKNVLTAKALLVLESKPIFNEEDHHRILEGVINAYFKDYEKYRDCFYPLFMMNDILRYWYTLTLNYEYWLKNHSGPEGQTKRYIKRIKLKYARLITCYSMLACLYIPDIDPTTVLFLAEMTPFERLDYLCGVYPELDSLVQKIKKKYSNFLVLRDRQDTKWWADPKNKSKVFAEADEFHSLVIHGLMSFMARQNKDLWLKSDCYGIR